MKVRKEKREAGGRKGRRKRRRRVRREGDPQWKLITVRHTYCEMLPRSLLATDYSSSCWEGRLPPTFSHWLLQIQKAASLGYMSF